MSFADVSSIDLGAARVQVEGITRLTKDAEAVGIAASDLTALNARLAAPIAARAAGLINSRSGRLAAGLKASRSKRKVAVRVGTPSRLPYAGVNHWGWDGTSGPQWLSRAEEELRPQTFAGFGEGIADLLKKHNW